MAALMTNTTAIDATAATGSPADEERPTTAPAPTGAVAVAVAPHASGSGPAEIEATDGQYGRVAMRGLIGGWVLGAVLFVGLARLGLPDVGWGWALGVGLGTAFWVGPFFGLLFANAAFQLDLEEERRKARRQATAARIAAATPTTTGGVAGLAG
jgi:hypothetical protein